MGDLYGIRQSSIDNVNTINRSLLRESGEQASFKKKSADFTKGIKDQRSDDAEYTDITGIHGVSTLGKSVGVARAGVMGAKQGVTGAKSALSSTSTGGDFLAESGAAMRGESASTLSTASKVIKGAAKGTISGISEAGGAGKTVAQLASKGGMSGTEGIVSRTLIKGGAGDLAGVAVGKAAGAIGGIIAVGQQADSLFDTGGKSMLDRTNAQGVEVKENNYDIAGQFVGEAGSIADIAAASTGGLLAPVAAAISVTGAILSAIGAYKDEKSDDMKAGIGSDGKITGAPKPPPQSIGTAYASLGFVGNQSHDPISAIR